MEDPTRYRDLDWREQLLRAIAYRITEQKGIEPDVTRAWVRDVMHRGPNSEHFRPVSEAIFEMFKPIAGHVLPFIPTIVRAVATTVEQENERGAQAEASVAQTRMPKS